MNPTDSDTLDSELAAILERLTDSRIEDRPTLQDLMDQYPHLSQALRELWGTIMVVDAVALHSHTDPTSAEPSFKQVDFEPPNMLGEFELDEEIGRGGMGVVYRARQREFGT